MHRIIESLWHISARRIFLQWQQWSIFGWSALKFFGAFNSCHTWKYYNMFMFLYINRKFILMIIRFSIGDDVLVLVKKWETKKKYLLLIHLFVCLIITSPFISHSRRASHQTNMSHFWNMWQAHHDHRRQAWRLRIKLMMMIWQSVCDVTVLWDKLIS